MGVAREAKVVWAWSHGRSNMPQLHACNGQARTVQARAPVPSTVFQDPTGAAERLCVSFVYE